MSLNTDKGVDVIGYPKVGLKKKAFDPSRLRKLLEDLSYNLDGKNLDIDRLVDNVTKLLPAFLDIDELFDLAAETAASRVTLHPDYSILAARLIATKLQRNNHLSFSENVKRLTSYENPRTHKKYSLVSKAFENTVTEYSEFFDSLIDEKRDFEFSYFGIKTLEKSYLLKLNESVAETPQFMFMRVAIGIHGSDLDSVRDTYELMSQKYFIHASPTLYNAGSEYNFLSSCFLVAMEEDSIDGIYKTLHTTALVSKSSGGIGLHVHNIRGSGSYIASSNGISSGLVPMLRVFNDTARYVDQGGNKRPGAFAIYLEPWHCDIFAVLELRKNHGKEELRTRDLFYGLWVPDLFMKRVKADKDWSLFSPNEAPGLSDCFGDEFEKLFEKYEAEGRAVKVIKAQKLWHSIIESQTETGGPYMLYKDACNKKSNQQNLGVIKSSNLCCEVVEYSSPEETAVCNLGSLALPSFLKLDKSRISVDYAKLHSVTKVLTKNLNKVIDVTKYPVASSQTSNMRHRPIAVGVQGLADLFLELRLPFDSSDAKKVNIQIFETIYHAAVEQSVELAISEGAYETFQGSPASKGLLQFDLWDNHKPTNLYNDWDDLKERVKMFGLRNSLLVAPMPTASTSQILGFNECFEPYTSNIYSRRVLAGEYQVVNKYLLKDLIDLGVWNSALKDKIIMQNGSIQGISGIPQDIKDLYRTVWEIPQKNIINMAADRAKFIDQLQSMNIHMQNPTLGKLTSCHFYGWEIGLKTGMYYLRTQAAARAIQFSLDTEEADKLSHVNIEKQLKRRKFNSDLTTPEKRDENNEDDLENGTNNRKRQRGEYAYNTPTSQPRTISEEEYDIHDTTPVACDITNPENCDSCSG